MNNTGNMGLYKSAKTTYPIAFVVLALPQVSTKLPDFRSTTGAATMPITHLKKDADKEVRSAFPRMGTPEEEEEDERLWAEQFANSEDFLMQIASDTREARRRGLLLPLETIFDD